MDDVKRVFVYPATVGAAVGLSILGTGIIAVELARIGWRHFRGDPKRTEPLLRTD